MAEKKFRNSDKLRFKDRVLAGFQPPEKQNEYLQERADANAAEEEARRLEEERLRKQGKAARKDAGY